MATVTLNTMAIEELAWWIKNLELTNCRAIIQSPSRILMQTDASKKGWGAVCQGIRTGGLWSKKEQEYHTNLLELLAMTFALLTLSKRMNFKSGHIQIDNQTPLSYLHYCRVPPRLPESSGMLEVDRSKGCHGMEIMSASIPENFSEGGSTTRDRSI